MVYGGSDGGEENKGFKAVDRVGVKGESGFSV